MARICKRNRDAVAVIGMSFRLPGGRGKTFWDRLVGGEDLVTEVEDGRWPKEKFLHPNRAEPGFACTFAGGRIEDALGFDAPFFGISPREAAHMDPQQRVLMHMTWEALEDAGAKASRLRGTSCGVFVGLSSFDYIQRMVDDLAAIDARTPTGNAGSIAANRISYFLDLRGPSMPVDTACSSSLVAVHQACNAMRLGECDSAIVGGISLHFHPIGFISFTKTGMLSPTGRCRPFDAKADGYVRSEGGGVVILKRLDLALKDGDRIHAVVEGSGINCDGRTNGITVPSFEAQAELLEEVYAKSGINPDSLDFLEAHGTGTAVGDPIEARAIGVVLGKRRALPLPVGSVKSNLGHLEAASGMAGLAKVLLMFRHRVIPPNLHFQSPNPRIDFGDLNLRVVTAATPLPRRERLTAGINSFGFGGANAHLVLSTPPDRKAPAKAAVRRAEMPFVVSATTPKALREVAFRTADFIAGHPEVALYDIAHALYARREWLPRRALCLAKDRQTLITTLRAYASGEDAPVVEADALPMRQGPVFVFTGNGGQWHGMGRKLFSEKKEFRRAVEEVDGIFSDYAPFSLLDHFKSGTATDLGRTELAQPLIFAIQVGMVRSLAAAGIKPAATVGHSLGEVAAAWACGALELEQAVRIIRLRSKHQQQTHNLGGMTVVAAPRPDVEALLADRALDGIEIAVSGENSPRSTSIAGNFAALVSFESILTKCSIPFQRLDLPYPFHSPLMGPVAREFAEEMGEIFAGEPLIPFYSSAAGQSGAGPLGTEYWEKNISEPVWFRGAIEAALEEGHRIFLEIGPHPSLVSHLSATLLSRGVSGHAAGMMTREKSNGVDFDAAAWRLVLGGIEYDWSKYFRRRPASVAELPHYPWQEEEFALPTTAQASGLIANVPEHPLLGWRTHGGDWEWENHLDTARNPWLADHKVGGAPVVPAAGFVEMALAAGSLRHPGQPVQIEDFEIRTPLVLDARRLKTVRLRLDEHDGHFVISSRDRLSRDPWQPHVTGRLATHAGQSKQEAPLIGTDSPEAELAGPEIYEIAKQLGLDYGPAFQSMEKVRSYGNIIAAELRIPCSILPEWKHYLLHPSSLDGALQSLFALFPRRTAETRLQAFLPVRMDRFLLCKPGQVVESARVLIKGHSERSLLADFFLIDGSGALVAAAKGWRFKAAQLVGSSFEQPRVFGQRWIERPRPRERSAFEGCTGLIARILRDAAGRLPRGSLLKRYLAEGDALLDAMCAAFALEALLPLADEGGILSLASAKSAEKVADGMEGYFGLLAGMLVRDGMATERAEGEWILAPNPEMPPATEIWRSLVADFPEKAARLGLVGRVGSHLPEIIAGSLAIENLLPRWTEVAGGGWALPKSGLAPDTQKFLVEALEQVCHAAPLQPRQILWITGSKPSAESFLAPWLRSRPGLMTCLLPESPEIRDLANRLAAFPEVSVSSGPLSETTLSQLVLERGLFDAVIAPPSQCEETYRWMRTCLLPGGILAVPLPERPRFADFIPHGAMDGVDTPDTTRVAVCRCFESTESIPLSPAGEAGLSLLLASKTSSQAKRQVHRDGVRSLVVPLTPEADAMADALVSSLATHGSADTELLPPCEPDASAIWEKLLAIKKPDRIVFVVASRPNSEWNPGADMAGQICALSAYLRATAKAGLRATACILTSGCFAEKGAEAEAWTNASLWGFARVARNEFGQLRIRCIDYGADTPLEDVTEEILTMDAENEVLLREKRRLVARVVADSSLARQILAADERAVLELDSPGPRQNIRWRRKPRRKPGFGEVAIAPVAAGLNFRDVMYSMGLLPEEALESGFAGQTLGMELSGIVTAVGRGVDACQPGDAVIAFAPASFSTETVTAASAVVPKPEELTFEAAATIPVAFYTAYHALAELAVLQPGERVLIHGAAGGVGLAAVQIARHIGAEVFATAGSDEKRAFLRLFGADHAFNSRTLEFADDIMRATGGEGVDVVLNSLAGEAVTKSLETLRPFGRFLELGKRGFYENSRIGLRPLRHNIRYFAVDADQLMAIRPDRAADGFRHLLGLFRAQTLSPLPLTVFHASEASNAFRFMQHSNQIGKVVLDLTDVPAVSSRKTASDRATVPSDGTYLVTGGLGGFGLETARWLVSQGARSLALLGRRGPADEAAKRFVEECRAGGVLVLADRCDVTDADDLGCVLEKIRAEMPPLRGVFHAAAVIDDALIMNLDPVRVREVTAPKVTGAELLHRLTRGDSLEWFVLYSSATTLFGNPGQSAYVAANAALEELAAHRRRMGLPATCVCWGPIGDCGYLSRHRRVMETLAGRTGGQPLKSSDALRFLGATLAEDTPQVTWMDLEWGTLSRFLPSSGSARYDMLSHLLATGASKPERAIDLRRELESMPLPEVIDTLKELLREQIADILRIAPDKLDETRPLLEVGMDSLMGAELMTTLEANLGVTVPVMTLSEGPSIAVLAERVSRILRPPGNAGNPAKSPLAAQSIHLAAQHALAVTPREAADLVAELGRSDRLS